MTYNETKHNLNWSLRKLNSLGDFSRGKSKHRPRNDKRLFENGGFPLVQTGEIKAANLYIKQHVQEYNSIGLKQSKLWNDGTLCITIAANIAETAILSYPACFPDSIVGFTAYKEETSELFMHYVFTFIRRAIQGSVSGSIQDNINIDYLENLNFRIPDKQMQDKIVEVLFSIDNKIEINNTINTELEKLAKTIYDYWFVQFDFPDQNGKPYKSSGGEMIYNETLKREIPVEWEVKDFGELADIATGKEDANFATINGYYPFFTCGQEMLWCNKSAFSGQAILLAGNGNFDVKHYCGEFNAYQRTYVIQPKQPAYYAAMFFALKDKVAALTKGSQGSIIKFLTIGDVEGVALPTNKKYIDKFDKLNSYIKQIQGLEQQNLELVALRDFLLPLLMNGQVTIKGDIADEPKIVSLTTANTAYQSFIQQVGLAARGDIDEATIRNIYKAHCEKAGENGQGKNRKSRP